MEAETINEYEDFYQINFRKNWENAEVCIVALTNLRKELEQTLSNLSESDFEKYPSIGIIYQLTERVFEHIMGGISCISTKNHASSEVLSRTAIEASVNIIFMLTDSTDNKVCAWLTKHITEDLQHIIEWEESLDQNNSHELDIHLPRITVRKELNTFKTEFVETLISEIASVIDIDQSYRWPSKILKKFKDIGEEIIYHTVYTRLSAQTHLTAEDTISYMVAKIYSNEENQAKMGLETIAFSEFMLIYSIVFYGKIAEKFCQKYADQSIETIKSNINDLEKIMIGIGEQWDW